MAQRPNLVGVVDAYRNYRSSVCGRPQVLSAVLASWYRRGGRRSWSRSSRAWVSLNSENRQHRCVRVLPCWVVPLYWFLLSWYFSSGVYAVWWVLAYFWSATPRLRRAHHFRECSSCLTYRLNSVWTISSFSFAIGPKISRIDKSDSLLFHNPNFTFRLQREDAVPSSDVRASTAITSHVDVFDFQLSRKTVAIWPVLYIRHLRYTRKVLAYAE